MKGTICFIALALLFYSCGKESKQEKDKLMPDNVVYAHIRNVTDSYPINFKHLRACEYPKNKRLVLITACFVNRTRKPIYFPLRPLGCTYAPAIDMKYSFGREHKKGKLVFMSRRYLYVYPTKDREWCPRNDTVYVAFQVLYKDLKSLGVSDYETGKLVKSLRLTCEASDRQSVINNKGVAKIVFIRDSDVEYKHYTYKNGEPTEKKIQKLATP